jgi:hypothetical protein
MISQVAMLNRLAIFDFPEYFSTLRVPNPASLRGFYKGYFVGPTWLRKLAKPLLTITGMGDWRGKFFDHERNIINLVASKGNLERKLPMKLVEQESLIDGKPGIVLSYAANNPFPWPWVIDEMRDIQEDLVLGMTIIQRGPLTRLPLPFLLQPCESPDEL